MRDYSHIDKYLDELQEDVYPSPADKAHTAWATNVIDKFLSGTEYRTVLDVGCGTGFCQHLLTNQGLHYEGITLGKDDFAVSQSKGRNVKFGDMSFLPYPNGSFDLIFARHVIEHSPFPLLTLMEWMRVATPAILIVVPAPDYWEYHGQNHYYVLNDKQWWNLFNKLGLRIIKEDVFKTSDPLFMKYYLPDEQDRNKVEFPGPPKLVEYRWLLEK